MEAVSPNRKRYELGKEDAMSGNLPEDRYVKVGNLNTRFWAAGDKGTAILLIHGLGGSVENWQPNIDAFAEKFRVYALDLPGFGRSDKPDVPYSVPYLAEFIPEFLAAQGIKKASVVGNSLGGAIAVHLASAYPDMVEKLVLVDPAGFGTESHILLRLISVPSLGEILVRPSRKGTTKVLTALFYDPSVVTKEMVEVGFEIACLPGYSRSFLATARSVLTIRGTKGAFVKSTLERSRQVRCPTLVIWGKEDRLLPLEHGYKAVGAIPEARLHLFDACGHCPQIEQADAFNVTVLPFLRAEENGP